ncbi:MAG TPA: DUF4118 domain-containing protein, partial [Candidatus Didemnitutus sp.]|nr:DUF4118 domain-containing protein [Candidatus Didemnitutus sp.]
MLENGNILDIDSLSRSQQLLRRPWPERYGFVFGIIALGWIAREILSPLIGPNALPYISFFPAVACSAWFGGLGPGIFAVLLACITARFFFIVPIYSLALVNIRDVTADIAFLVSSTVIVAAIEAMHRARRYLLIEIQERERLTRELARARDSLATTLAS